MTALQDKINTPLKDGEDIDQWVEEIGTLGAMNLHPAEFTADEIMAELHADNLDEMTEGMAEVIVKEYGYQPQPDMEAWKYFPHNFAIGMLVG